jgi:cytochrome c oxidase assembly factor CtaG
LKLSVPESAAMGVLVNTPGLMVLILLNVGSDVGVFSSGMFAVMMANAMLRNLLVTPALRRLQRAGLPEMSEFRVERGL